MNCSDLIRPILIILGVAAFAAACAFVKPVDLLNSVTPKSGYELEADVAYGALPRQKLDLYRSVSGAGNPLVVFIYGGAWRDGDKADYEFVAQAFAESGYSIAIPDYRLFPTVGYPEIIDDPFNAIVFLKNNARDLNIDPTRIVLVGHSSGAHAAALIATSPRYLADQDNVIGLIGISGPYDLPLDNLEVADVFKAIKDEKSVSPPSLVGPTHPRTLLLHGADDERVAPRHTLRYERSLRDHAVPVSVALLADVGHADILAGVSSRLEFLNSTREEIMKFLDTF